MRSLLDGGDVTVYVGELVTIGDKSRSVAADDGRRRCSLFVVRRSSFFVRRPSSVVRRPPSVARRVPFVARRSPLVVCRPPSTQFVLNRLLLRFVVLLCCKRGSK